MPRKYLRRWVPDRDKLNRNAMLRRFAPLLTHHNLWHLNRRSVAGGLAVGLFAGMIPGPLQMLGATLLAVWFRVNLPVAIFGTLFSNPFTIVPLYALALGLGHWLTGSNGPAVLPTTPETDWTQLGNTAVAWLDWLLALGWPLAVGLVTLASLLAVLGYAIVHFGWRLHVLYALRQRRQRPARL